MPESRVLHKLSAAAMTPSTLLGSSTHQTSIKRIAVFCGSSDGNGPQYVQLARDLGAEMVRREIGLVYGGGNSLRSRLALSLHPLACLESTIKTAGRVLGAGNGGLMGAISHAVVDGLGEQNVLGIIPEALEPQEISGQTQGQLRIVPDMHTRKARAD